MTVLCRALNKAIIVFSAYDYNPIKTAQQPKSKGRLSGGKVDAELSVAGRGLSRGLMESTYGAYTAPFISEADKAGRFSGLIKG